MLRFAGHHAIQRPPPVLRDIRTRNCSKTFLRVISPCLCPGESDESMEEAKGGSYALAEAPLAALFPPTVRRWQQPESRAVGVVMEASLD